MTTFLLTVLHIAVVLTMYAFVLTYILFVWFPSAKSQDSRQCYWPDGTTTSSTGHLYLPCSNGGPSNCCADGEACLSNGLCFGAAIGSIYRGACTDSSWGNYTACPQYCNNQVMWVNILNCYDIGQIWCGNTSAGATICETGNGAELHDYPSGTVEHIANTTYMYASDTPSVTATSSSSATGTTALSNNNSTAISNDFNESKGVPVTVPIGVGVGVGVPLAILAVALGVMLGRERRRRVEAENRMNTRPNDVAMRYDDQMKDTQVYRQQSALYDHPPFELNGGRDPAELPSRK